MLEREKAIYFDMDGVLTHYYPEDFSGPHPLWLSDPDYFLHCKPNVHMMRVLEQLTQQASSLLHVGIITSVALTPKHFRTQSQAKRMWLKQQLSERAFDALTFDVTVSSKAQVAKKRLQERVQYPVQQLTSRDFLIDDYMVNILSWDESGGRSIKYANGINDPRSYNGFVIGQEMTSEDIVQFLLAL